MKDQVRSIAGAKLLAGSIYIIGAAGGDMVAGKYISIHGNGFGWPYVVKYHIEETLEMVGIVYFIYALLIKINAGVIK